MVDTITATLDAAQAGTLVYVHVEPGPGAPQLSVTIDRSADSGVTWAQVPNAVDLPMVMGLGEIFETYVWDHGFPLGGSVTYRATTSPVEITVTSLAVTGSSVGDGWLKDPARPWANLSLDLCPSVAECALEGEPAVALVYGGLGTESYDSDASLFPVLNRRRPGDVYAVRKDATTSARFISRTRASQDAMNTLFAWGGPVLLQLPENYGWCDRYYQPGTVETSRVSRNLTRPFRLWDAPLTVVDAPVGPAQGTVENNWCVIAARYPTWGDLTGSGLTWGQITSGAAAPVPLPEGGYGGGGYGEGPYGD